MSSNKQRAELRGEMKRVLSSLDNRWLEAASRQVCDNLTRIVEHDLRHGVDHILAWTSFFPGEVNLSSFISEQIGKRGVYLPRILPDYSMTFVEVGKDWFEQIQTGHLGLPEPYPSQARTYDTALAPRTAVIVPGLAFDKEGTRLGRGKGYYDRFFARPHMREAEKIGVCWQLQLVNAIAMQPHDVPVEWVCHEHFGFQAALSRKR